MRRFRVIDGSTDNSVTVPADGADAADPVDPHLDGTEAPPSGDGNAPEPAAQGNAADGLITAKKGYDAAMQTTRKIRQRSLLDFLR